MTPTTTAAIVCAICDARTDALADEAYAAIEAEDWRALHRVLPRWKRAQQVAEAALADYLRAIKEEAN
jgi:hypothetical protein